MAMVDLPEPPLAVMRARVRGKGQNLRSTLNRNRHAGRPQSRLAVLPDYRTTGIQQYRKNVYQFNIMTVSHDAN
jgi:hypothetical protein